MTDNKILKPHYRQSKGQLQKDPDDSLDIPSQLLGYQIQYKYEKGTSPVLFKMANLIAMSATSLQPSLIAASVTKKIEQMGEFIMINQYIQISPANLFDFFLSCPRFGSQINQIKFTRLGGFVLGDAFY